MRIYHSEIERMAEPAKNPNPFDLLLEQIRAVVREEIKTALDTAGVSLRDKEWLRADEAEKLYGFPATWFEARGRAGKIARSKPGRYVLFKRQDIEQYLERNNGKERNEAEES